MNCLGNDPFRTSREPKSIVALILEGLSFASRLLALVVLVIYLPVLIGLGLMVLLTSPGPAFVKRAYRRRGAAEGEVVYLYEFRTECFRTWQETWFGTFLRLADLYRLPRLVNVLRGDVAVGERVQRVRA